MTNSTNHDIIKIQTKEREERKMTKFEKVSMRAELLERAYNLIMDADKWDNMDYDNSYETVRDDRKEQHEFYLSIAKEIEKLL